MKRLFIYVFIIIIVLQFACEKTVIRECEDCVCFNFVEPLRISYQNSDNIDLISNGEIVIDSISGHIYFDKDTFLSEQLHNMEYDIKNWVGLPEYRFKYSFIEMKNELVGFYLNYKNEISTKGIGVDHEFYIYTNIGIDTINVRWDMILTPREGCCNDCVSFPYKYMKCNKIELIEGTETGAAIIRK